MSFPFHPILIALFPIFSLYAFNIAEVRPDVMVLPIILTLAGGSIVWSVSQLLLRNKHAASIYTSIILILVFSYGHIYLMFTNAHLHRFFPVGPNIVLLGLYGLLLASLSVIFFKKKDYVEKATPVFNIMSIVLILSTLIQIVPQEWNRASSLSKLSAYLEKHPVIDTTFKSDTKNKPDIYYFIFDRYGRQDVLKEYFNVDNTEFIEFLEDTEFYVATQSAANYPTTYQSIASSLNMTHLTHLTELFGKDYTDKTVVNTMLQDHELQKFLKKQGYTYIHFGDHYNPTKQNRYADENINLFLNNEPFHLQLYENTIFNTLSEKIFGSKLYSGVLFLNNVIKNHQTKFNAIADVVSEPGPKFIFAHFLLPHEPFLMKADCTPLSFEEVRARSRKTGYVDQLHCANKYIKKLIASILEESENPPIIIIQSDEGPFLPEKFFDDHAFNPKYAEEAIQIHSKILNAYYLPNSTNSATVLYSSITPVNSFRLIFNTYFGTHFDLLEDRSYVNQDDTYPLNFTEVTEIIK